MDVLIELLEQVMPLVLTALGTGVVAGINRVSTLVPRDRLPMVLPIVGGVVLAAANALGVTVGPEALQDIDGLTAGVLGVMGGLAMTGVHQIKKQADKRKEEAS